MKPKKDAQTWVKKPQSQADQINKLKRYNMKKIVEEKQHVGRQEDGSNVHWDISFKSNKTEHTKFTRGIILKILFNQRETSPRALTDL